MLTVFEYNQHFVAMMNIINAARLNPPVKGHIHHIIPRCWFKLHNIEIDNSDDNLVKLTQEDHIKVHKLMMLCVKDANIKSKMAFAVHRLTSGEIVYNWIGPNKGKKLGPLSEEHKAKLSVIGKNIKHDETWNRHVSESLTGKKLTVEHKAAVSEGLKKFHAEHPECKSRGSTGMHWYTNGTCNIMAFECPDNYWKGRTK